MKLNITMVFNIIPSTPAKAIGITPSPMGGWLMSMVNALYKLNQNLKITILSPYTGQDLKEFKDEKYSYVLMPHSNNRKHWRLYLKDYKPDIIHINGTEQDFSLPVFDLRNEEKIIVSIQGIITEIAKHSLGGINTFELLKSITFKDLVRRSSPFHMNRRYQQQALIERDMLKKADAIIGRTSWDYSFIQNLGLEYKYYKVNENLRDEFYVSEKWELNTKERTPVLFCSQGAVPYKGLHILLEALPIIKRIYPNIKVKIAGYNPTKNIDVTDKITRSTYGRYLMRKIKEYDLERNIEFIGLIDSKQMIENYLNSDIFVQTSMIENSPNSLGEAMYLGVPVVASFVGGTKDYINDEESGILYDSNDVMKLASEIISLLNNDSKRESIGMNASNKVLDIYNREKNANDLLTVYQEVYKG